MTAPDRPATVGLSLADPSSVEDAGGRAPLAEVWLADLRAERAAHHALLDPVEQRRRAAYARDVDRSRFTVAAALLRLVAARECGMPPEAVRVERRCPRCPAPHGKPRLVDTLLHVSVSHSEERVAVAVTRAAPIGVDVEHVRRADIAGLAEAVLADDEPLTRPEEFFVYWCRKEAVVKATGDGLCTPLRAVRVSPAREPARLLSYRGGPVPCALADLDVGSGYAGAVAVLTDRPLRVRIRDGAALLSE